MFEARSSKVSVQRTPLRSHEDLEAYKLSMDLLVRVHDVCKRLPPEEKYELGSQMRRASKSIPANVAEGFSKRASVNEFKHYMRTAMASANEMETHLHVTERLGYLPSAELGELIDGYNHIGRQLNRLITNWKSF